MNKEVIGYYQSNIKTSRNEDSVYAMKYASQQMLINKLQQENKELHNKIDKAIEYINEFPLIHYSSIEKIEGKRLSGKLVPVDDLLEILKESE